MTFAVSRRRGGTGFPEGKERGGGIPGVGLAGTKSKGLEVIGQAQGL